MFRDLGKFGPHRDASLKSPQDSLLVREHRGGQSTNHERQKGMTFQEGLVEEGNQDRGKIKGVLGRALKMTWPFIFGSLDTISPKSQA